KYIFHLFFLHDELSSFSIIVVVINARFFGKGDLIYHY
ncbi:uncharacterized protein METZ01_LOCUS127692, partial [marine metagenome]